MKKHKTGTLPEETSFQDEMKAWRDSFLAAKKELANIPFTLKDEDLIPELGNADSASTYTVVRDELCVLARQVKKMTSLYVHSALDNPAFLEEQATYDAIGLGFVDARSYALQEIYAGHEDLHVSPTQKKEIWSPTVPASETFVDKLAGEAPLAREVVKDLWAKIAQEAFFRARSTVQNYAGLCLLGSDQQQASMMAIRGLSSLMPEERRSIREEPRMTHSAICSRLMGTVPEDPENPYAQQILGTDAGPKFN